MGYKINAKLHVLQRGNEWVTSKYGMRTITVNGKTSTSMHSGIDLIDAALGTDYIIAAADGIVKSTRNTIAGYSETYGSGNYVTVDHGNGYSTEYYHMKQGSVCVSSGQVVKKGQVIGFMGTTGWSTGNHLHFGIRINGATVDPEPYLLGEKTIGGSVVVVPTEIVGTPVERNTAVNQVEVLIDDLRARVRPEMNDNVISGYIRKGTYNVVATRDMTQEASNGYSWYEVEPGKWIAKGDAWTSYYPAQAADDKDKQIAELQKENAAQKAALVSVRDISMAAVPVDK